MHPLFLFVFIITLIFNHIRNGGDFVMFSRIVELMNSVREDTPRASKKIKNGIMTEYKFGNKIYAIVVPLTEKFHWHTVATLIDDRWEDVTGEIEYMAGPAKNFHGIKVTPNHLNRKYELLAFAFSKQDILHVKKDEVILSKMKKFLKKNR